MPRLNSMDMENTQLTGAYGYSAVGLDKLGATEYTLVTMLCDTSGSVAQYSSRLESALQMIVKSCKGSREENLLLRLLTFDDRVEEVHGYKLMDTCDPANYMNILNCGGSTALFDATANAVEAALDYGKKLSDQDYTVNAAIYILTDGENNRGTTKPVDIKQMLEAGLQSEAVESVVSILIGLNNDAYLDKLLSSFAQEAGLTHYEGIGQITESSLRAMTGIISKSISLQSKSLAGTTVGSQPLIF